MIVKGTKQVGHASKPSIRINRTLSRTNVFSGNGILNGLFYQNGSLFSGYYLPRAPLSEGSSDLIGVTIGYYINGVLTSLSENGTGFWQNKHYIGGVETTLNSSGTGAWNDKYYIGGSETTLNSNGNGIWNNQIYFDGLAASSFNNLNISPESNNGIKVTSVAGLNPNSNITIPAMMNEIPVFKVQFGYIDFQNIYNIDTITIGGIKDVFLHFSFKTIQNIILGEGIENLSFGDYINISSDLAIPRTTKTFSVGYNSLAGPYFSDVSQRKNLFSPPIFKNYISTSSYSFRYYNVIYYNGWFDGVYYINNNATATTLDQNGNGLWNGKIYVNGITFTGTLLNNAYYIDGTETDLDSSGTGLWNNKVYQNGIELNISGSTGSAGSAGSAGSPGPGLGLDIINQILKDLNFTGTIYDRRYINGDPVTGLFEGIYYIQGAATTLPLSGTGVWQNKYYIGGSETTLPLSGTGVWQNKYYIGGVETTLNSSGTGAWNDKYYIGGVETTLDSSGTGGWDDKLYQNGVVITTYGNYNVAYENVGVTLSAYTGNEALVNVPSQVLGLPVKKIGNQAFFGKTNITNVVIPNSVTSIGDYAFQSCTSLISVTIPNSVTSIGEGAFQICTSLTSVTIPNSVTSIGAFAFLGCSGLTSVTIPNSVTSIGNTAFQGCSGLTSIILPQAFFTELSRIGLTQVNLSVYYIGVDNIIRLNQNGTLVNVLSNYTSTLENGGVTLSAYTGNETSVNIPNQVAGLPVKNIGDSAFYNKLNMTSVTIPNSVISIGNQAFLFCRYLTSVTIPNSVTSIGYYAFNGCNRLTSATIPNSVTSIGIGAFYDTALTTITIPNSVTSIESLTFFSCDGLTSITIPNSVTSIGNGAFNSCLGLTSITIPNSVTSIGNGAFNNAGLTSIILPQIFSTELDRIGINPNINITYTIGFPISGIVAFWNLNETSGTRYDATTNGKDLTEFSSVSSTTGKVGNCATFNGTNGGGGANSRLGTTSFGINPNVNFSFSVWMKPRSFSGYQHIIGAPFQNGFYIGANGPQFGSTVGYNLTFNLFNSTVYGISAPTTAFDTWHHYVFIRDGNTLKLYADNVYIGSASVAGQSFGGASVFSVGGGEFDEYYFNGDIDSIGVWNRPLTESEISSLYNSGNGLEYQA